MMFRRQETLITLESRGKDAREVFAELFAQAKVDFVLQVDIARPVYLTLRETPFLRALQLLCEATNTRYSIRDGVYYIAPLAAAPPPPPMQATERPRTVRLVGNGLTLRGIAAEISKQAGVKVTVSPDAPDQPLRCPKCRYALQLDWRYCPICGAYVKHLTDRAKREQESQKPR